MLKLDWYLNNRIFIFLLYLHNIKHLIKFADIPWKVYIKRPLGHSNLLRKTLFNKDYKYYHKISASAFDPPLSAVIEYNMLIPLCIGNKSDYHI